MQTLLTIAEAVGKFLGFWLLAGICTAAVLCTVIAIDRRRERAATRRWPR